MRFYFNFTSTSKYVYLDNIKITAMVPGNSAVLQINGTQVSFDSNGNPQKGGVLTSTRDQVLPNFQSDGVTPHGYSYSCYRDVTALVQAYTNSPITNPPSINKPGNATYTVGGVVGDTGDDWSYAGWSIIIIYTGPSTLGHQLYLYDKFMYAGENTDINFGNQAVPYGGTVSGFIVPHPVPGEVNSAKLTACVAEGDACWSGDFIAFNAPSSYWNSPTSQPWNIPDPTFSKPWKLWDGITLADNTNTASHPDNVWNSHPADGLDIKTFPITWASGMLNPGDTSAHIDLPTVSDSWNLMYMILSFRSSTTTGNALSYLISG